MYISHGNIIQLGEEKINNFSNYKGLKFLGGKRMHFFTEENFPYVLISVSRQEGKNRTHLDTSDDTAFFVLLSKH